MIRALAAVMAAAVVLVWVLGVSGAAPGHISHSTDARAGLNACLRLLNYSSLMPEAGRIERQSQCRAMASVQAGEWGSASHANVVLALIAAQDGTPDIAISRLKTSQQIDPTSYWLATLRASVWQVLPEAALPTPCTQAAYLSDLRVIARADPAFAGRLGAC